MSTRTHCDRCDKAITPTESAGRVIRYGLLNTVQTTTDLCALHYGEYVEMVHNWGVK